jgi:PRTRC genetic system protein C
MARIFIVDNREQPDPDPTLTIEQVRDSLAEFFPELAQSTWTTVARGEDQVIDFTRRVGTKGVELFAREHQHQPLVMLRDLVKLYMLHYQMTAPEAKAQITKDLAEFVATPATFR